MKKNSINISKLARLAVLIAVIVIMANTPIGFLMIGPVSITFMMIPVAVAAITVGPVGGAIAGGVFGLTAFLRGLFGVSPFAVALMNIDPILTFILMVVPRILAGLIPGLIFKTMISKDKSKTSSALAACFVAPLANTILFVSSLYLMFGATEFIASTFGGTFWAVAVALVGTNGLIEAGVGFVVGAAVSRAIVHFVPGNDPFIRRQNA
ncbi:MAG: ECF transporter S component [Oscillospiraceae bacterium]|nr:ECF transporter S component [Oscillospiraceae bacterium]